MSLENLVERKNGIDIKDIFTSPADVVLGQLIEVIGQEHRMFGLSETGEMLVRALPEPVGTIVDDSDYKVHIALINSEHANFGLVSVVVMPSRKHSRQGLLPTAIFSLDYLTHKELRARVVIVDTGKNSPSLADAPLLWGVDFSPESICKEGWVVQMNDPRKYFEPVGVTCVGEIYQKAIAYGAQKIESNRQFAAKPMILG